MNDGRCAIAVMAKAPRPGKVKTRLQPVLSPEDAMALSAGFLRDITENIRLAAPGDRVVLGPAEDGGYYIIGMKAEHAGLFSDIAWSTATVAAQTRERAAALGLELVELDTWYDVDDNAALQRLMLELSGGDGKRDAATPYHAPATAACLRRLGLADRLGDAAG
jgi:glycosyltransferase A (GT-A) superfamily protein (DUF2064 family)